MPPPILHHDSLQQWFIADKNSGIYLTPKRTSHKPVKITQLNRNASNKPVNLENTTAPASLYKPMTVAVDTMLPPMDRHAKQLITLPLPLQQMMNPMAQQTYLYSLSLPSAHDSIQVWSWQGNYMYRHWGFRVSYSIKWCLLKWAKEPS
jgi:hypothetical protein